VGELLERDDLLHLLCGHLHDAAAGAGRLVLIRGEAGVGKTAVVRRFATFAGSTARILVGARDPLSTPRPLGPLVDVAADLGQGLAEALERALHGSRSVSGVFQRLLAELQTEPVVVVFEDMHWADEATLDLLRYLARRIDRTRRCWWRPIGTTNSGPPIPWRSCWEMWPPARPCIAAPSGR
jgi:predicted ATPase